MSALSQKTMLELMAYADGELEGEALARIEALLEANEDARRVVEGFNGPASDALGSWLEANAKSRADDAAVDSIAAAVMEKVAGQTVVSLDSRRRTKAVLAVAALVAMAAGVAVYLRSSQPADVAQQVPPTNPVVTSPTPAPIASDDLQLNTTAVAGVEVHEVPGDVSVFYVASPGTENGGGNANASVVVWLNDDQAGGGK